MRARTHTWARRLAVAGTLLPLLASAACGSSSSSNTASSAGGGGGGSAASVTITEKMGPPDSYAFSPATVSVPSGQSLSIVNKSDENHTLSCSPDPGVSSSMLTINKTATQAVSFPKAGTYNCSSSTHPDAKITITVS